jgi:L-seryl-tRNA(Ser) seleniumtransferase
VSTRTPATSKTRSEPVDDQDARRAVPSVDALLRSAPGRRAISKFGRPLVKQGLLSVLTDVRARLQSGQDVPDESVIMARAVGAVARDYYGLSEVINATGVILHTGLGRAPLPRQSAAAVAEAARGFSDLEVDRASGARGRRTARAESLVTALTGAEDALIVNNNAAALLVALAALASGKDVLVARGELIEIGGEFRLPEIMAASGARLVEVGTTNRTRPGDYRKALTRRTGLILKVHPSNYRVVGFTNAVQLGDLAKVARESKVPLLYDVGSGLLDRYPEVPVDEPAVTEALAGGADLASFSGDKLLGGPQAGVVAGRAELVEKLRRHPMARALRVDKLTVAALEAVLRLYATDRRDEVPVWSLLSISQSRLLDRAKALSQLFRRATARTSEGAAGGGSLPGYAIPSAELVVAVKDPSSVAARLRQGRPPVFCRVDKDAVAFDLRTVPVEDDDRLVRAIRYALEQS